MAVTNPGKSLTRSSSQWRLGSIIYSENPDFPNDVLPTKKVIIEIMRYLLHPSIAGKAQHSEESSALMLAKLVQEHWLFCNIYTINTRQIQTKILKLHDEISNLAQTRKERRNANYNKKIEEFNASAEMLSDIFCKNEQIRKHLELHGVKMTSEEWEFLNDQSSEKNVL